MSFPPYPKHKDSGVEWLGAIPTHWQIVPLKHVASLKGRLGWQGLRADEYTEEGPYLVTSEHLEGGKVQWERCYHVTHDRFMMAPEIQLREHDLLMMKDGAAMGKLGYIDSLPGPACLNSHLLLFRPMNGEFENLFLYYLLGTPAFAAYMVQKRTGTTFFGISQESIGSFPFPLPRLEEQQAILHCLTREVSAIDSLIEEQRRLIELLKEKRQAVISHAVTKGLNPDAPMKPSGIDWLGDVPRHWRVVRLKHVTALLDGIQMGPFGGMLLDLSSEDTGFRVYGQQNTISGDFKIGQRWITAERYDELKAYSLLQGDIVLTRKGSLGNARLIRTEIEPGVIDSDTIRLRLREDLASAEFVSFLLHESPYIDEQIQTTKRGAILSGINSETVANLVLALPPRREQTAMMAHLVEEMDRFKAWTSDVSRAIELLEERRSALISAAVTGKIDVRQAVLEPVA